MLKTENHLCSLCLGKDSTFYYVFVHVLVTMARRHTSKVYYSWMCRLRHKIRINGFKLKNENGWNACKAIIKKSLNIKHPETSRNIPNYSEIWSLSINKSLNQHPETSRNFPKHPETSRTHVHWRLYEVIINSIKYLYTKYSLSALFLFWKMMSLLLHKFSELELK